MTRSVVVDLVPPDKLTDDTRLPVMGEVTSAISSPGSSLRFTRSIDFHGSISSK